MKEKFILFIYFLYVSYLELKLYFSHNILCYGGEKKKREYPKIENNGVQVAGGWGEGG